MYLKQPLKFFSYLCCVLALASCSRKDADLEEAAERDQRAPKTKLQRLQDKTKGYIFGEPLLAIGSKKAEESNIGVNSYLWRASLDVVADLPKEKADPFGGVIVTGWQMLEDNKDRLKVEIVIIGRQLRADALRVSVFRQKRQGNQWKDASVSRETISEIEETILKRARDIRVREEK